MKKNAWIPTALYKKILASMPIPCVDLVLVSGGSRKKFLLGKRKNKPAQHKWWLVGGRVNKGEQLEVAARRHIKTETGISKVKIKKQLGSRGTMFTISAQGPSVHSINTVYLVEIPFAKTLTPYDSENSEMRWFSKIDPKWPAYVKEMVRLAGFK